MNKLAVLYSFPESAFEVAGKRLRRLQTMNPNVTFFPVAGSRQFFYFPMAIDNFMFGSTKNLPLVGIISHQINWIMLSAPGVFRLSESLNKKLFKFAKKNQLAKMQSMMNHESTQPLSIDYTPMALWNLDQAIINWFNIFGRKHDFDNLVFYEYDIFTTKPLEEIYKKYLKYDACFTEYQIATKNWHFYKFPIGCKGSIKRWLKQRGLQTEYYRSLFAGVMISRRVLEKLNELKIGFTGTPRCQNEMRLPTILTAMGFNCCNLDFPFVRYRPMWTENEILMNKKAGIFHPVKKLISPETSSD